MTKEELEKLKKNADKYSSTTSRSTTQGGGINQEQFNSLKENADKYVSSTARYATQGELANYYKNGAPTLTDGIMKARYGHVLKSQAYMSLSDNDRALMQLNNQVNAYKKAKDVFDKISYSERNSTAKKSDSWQKSKTLVDNLEKELQTQYKSIFGADADFKKWLGGAVMQGVNQFNVGLANTGAMASNLIPGAINDAIRYLQYGHDIGSTAQLRSEDELKARQNSLIEGAFSGGWVNQYEQAMGRPDEEMRGWLSSYEKLKRRANELSAKGNYNEADIYNNRAQEFYDRISNKYADYLKSNGNYWTLPEGDDPLSEYAQMVNDVYARGQEEYEKQLEYQKMTASGSGKGYEIAGQFITSATAALPYAGLALMTGGASLAQFVPEGQTLVNAATLSGSGIGAQLAPQTTDIIGKVSNILTSFGKDPQYWLSFAQEAGNTYKEAIDAGADSNVATLTATLVGLINGAIELGFGGNAGIQDLPENLLKGKGAGTRRAIQEWIESALSEGKEEVLQGVISNLAEKIAYNKDKKWIGEGGVFDPQSLSQEGLMGAGVGALLGGGQIMGVNAMNQTVQNRIDQANARLGQRYSEQADTIIQNARQMGPETRSYQLASNILEKGSNTDAEIGELYRAYMSDTGYNQNLRTNTIQAVQQRLTELGETSDTRELAEIIAKEADGQKITKAETQAIENSKYGQRVVNELFNAYRGDYSSNWVRGLATQDEMTTAKAAPELTQEQRAERIESIEQNRPEHTEEDYKDIDKLAQKYGEQANVFKEAAKSVEGVDLYYFDDAYHLVYQEAKAGLSENTIRQDVKASWLSPAAFKLAFNAGQSAIKMPKGSRFSGSAGVRLNGIDYKSLDNKQRASVRALQTIAQITGIRIELFDSTQADGTLGEKQGWYSKGAIGIDINAGMLDKNDILNVAMLRTTSHELTHFIQDNNDTAYKELKDFVFSALQTYQFSDGKYRDADTWIRSKMSQNKWEYEEGTAEFNKYYQQAADECVADACEMMLRDTTAFETLAKENQSLAQKMLAWLKQLIADIKEAFSGVVETSLEARAMLDSLDELQKKWDAALVGAVQNTKEYNADGVAMTNEEAFMDSAEAVQNQIRPPYTDKTKAFYEFADNLNPEARETFDLFYGFYQRSRLTNTTNAQGKPVKGINISAPYLTVQQWNDKLKADKKWAECARGLAEFLPEKVRTAMRMNEDGTLKPNPLEERFKMQISLAQRLVDALPLEKIDINYKLGDKTIKLSDGKAVQSVGGEAYRRAVIDETRKLYNEGKLKKVSIGAMSKDRWGSLGFLAANGKTGASGDLTTLCPQMMFNEGCFYCYRRAAMETGVNNKLVAQRVWYTGEILRIKDSDVKALNENGGLRIQSFGDWMPQFSAQLADILYDAELRGLQVKIITKEPSMIEYVARLKDQGVGKNLYFNLSADYAIEKGPAAPVNQGAESLAQVNWERPFMRDDDGTFWWKRAMTVEEAWKYHEKHPWVNVRIVATDIDEFIRGLKDPHVYVVTGYHGHIRTWDRIDSTTGQRKIQVEPLGDRGMPVFSYNPKTKTWVTENEGATKIHKALANAIEENGLQKEYYTKTCCITGRCAECNGKCGALANSTAVKNATNDDAESVAYWQERMTKAEIEADEIGIEMLENENDAQFSRRVTPEQDAENEDIRYQNRIGDIEESEEAPKEKAPTNPYYAKRDLRTDMLNLFSIPAGRRAEMGAIIDKYADKMLEAGAITQYDYDDLIDELYANGVIVENAAPEYAEVRKMLKGKKVYVPERVRIDFGDDWSAFRKRAFSAGIYLTNNVDDMHPDQWNATLASDLPGLFDAQELDERTMLEQMVDYANLGKNEQVPLNKYESKLVKQGVVDEGALSDEYERKVQQQLEKFAEKAKLEVVLRERSDKVINKQRAALETARRRTRSAAVRKSITAIMDRWNTKLTSNTPAKNIPAQFAAAMSELSQAMDLTSDKPLSPAAVDKLTKLWAVYDSIDNDKDFSIYKDPVVQQMVDNIVTNIINDTKVRYMSLEQLNELYAALKALDTVMRTATKAKDAAYRGSIYEIGKLLMLETNEARASKSEFWRDLNTWQLTPRRFFAMLGGWKKGSVWETQVAKSFEDGRRRALRVERDHYNHYKAFTEAKEMDRLTDIHKLVDIGLLDRNGEPVKITRGMMLSIYMHLLAEDNRRAILYGGFNIPDLVKYYGNKIAAAYGTGHENTVGILEDMTKLSREILDINENDDLTEEEKQEKIAEIAKKQHNLEKEGYDRLDALKNRIYNEMSDFEKKLCEAVTAWNDGKSRDYINEVNMEMYGIKRARVKNYYRIHRDTSFVQTDFASISKNANLNNVGWLKDRVKSAAPVLLTDIVYEIDNGIKSLSTYYGFVKAQTDFTKIYNVKRSGANVSVKGTVGDKFGKGPKSFGVTADQYIENFIGDVVGSRLKPEATIFAAIRRNLPRATLTLNPRVALSQIASVPTAAAEVGWGSMIRGFAKGIPHAFSKSYKENLASKSEYFFQRYRGEGGMREFADMKSGSNALDKLWNKMANTAVGRVLFNWCQDADVFATTTMWAMAEDWVAHNTNLKGEEFDAAVKEKFEDILIDTQPNYTPTERSDLLRDTREMYKFLTMYKTQSNQNYNILVEANARLRRTASDFKNGKNGVTQQDLKEARKQFANAYTGLFIGGTLTFIGFRALVNALLGHMNEYRDDDDEITTVSVLEGLTKAYMQSIAGMFVLGTEIENAIESVVTGKKYYGLEDSALSTVGNGVESFINLAQAYAQGKTDNIGGKWAKFAQNTLQTAGLPYSSVKTFVEGGKTWINDIERGTFGQFEGNVTRSNKTNYSRLYQAYENGDTGKAERIMDELYRNDPDIEDSEIRNGLRDVIKDMWSGGLISDGEAVEKLVEYVGMDDDPAYWKVQEWYNKSIDEEAGSSPYYRLKSVITNDEDASDAITELLDHGKKADDVADYIRNDIIKAAFKDGEITEAEAVEKLVKYGQKKDHSKLVKYTQADAQAIVDNWSKTNSLGWDYSKKAELLQSGEVSKAEIKKAIMDIEGKSSEKADEWIAKNSLGWSYQDRAYLYNAGDITKSELKKALMSVDGMSSEQAEQTIETYEWSNAGYEVEPNQYNAIIGTYYDTIQKAGISKAIWYDYYKWQSKARADKDADGNSINGTKMAKVFDYIGKLNITSDQKMALARTYTDNEKSIAKYKTW